jgi:hypothetical protein
MEIKLSHLEAGLLVRCSTSTKGPFGTQFLSVLYLTSTEKAACKRLVKKGLMTNLMDTFYEINAAGLEHVKSIS